MKIPDDIRKRAEELITTLLARKKEYFLTPDTVTTASHCRAWEDGAQAGYLQCYTDLMSGGPDGWCPLDDDGKPMIGWCHDSLSGATEGFAKTHKIVPVKLVVWEE